MAMSSLLLERIANATNAEDLLPIFQSAPIDILRDVANIIVDRITQNETKSIKFKSCSLHKIIGNDLTQKILSFIPHHTPVQCVDKTFKILNDKNTKMRLNESQKLINNQNFETNFEKTVESIFNTKNKNTKQVLLTEKKISSKYIDNKEVYNSFDDIFKQNESTNKIIVFVEDGEYEFYDNDSNWFKETMAIIGIGENARINLYTCDDELRFYTDNVYIQGITLISSDKNTFINATDKINLWMKNVVFKRIRMTIEDANFYAKTCKFICENTENEPVVRWYDVSDSYNMDIIGCTFNSTDSINSFIEIEANDGVCCQIETAGNIRIIGNIFNGKCLQSTITAIHPDGHWNRFFASLHIGDSGDWDEPVKVNFSAHLTMECNFIIGYQNSHINPNQFQCKGQSVPVCSCVQD